jgi:hypothetical protein
VVDGAPYLAKSWDGRERAVIELRYQDAGYWVLLTAELPGGEHFTGTFGLLRETRPLNFLPPPARDYVGRFDAGLPEPCGAWLGEAKDAELRLHISYHAMAHRFRAGIALNDKDERVAGDWLGSMAMPKPD